MRAKGWLAALTCLAASVGACSTGSGSTSAACTRYCDDACAALAACPSGAPPGCSATCFAGSDRAACTGSLPPDQQTCAQLTKHQSCADYCTTLCAAAPSCGSFDPGLCLSGCAHTQPSLCNSASVAARTCDQLKPELQVYQAAGSALARGEAFGSSGSPKVFGLCTSAFDCPSPLGCSAATNTCGPCATNADCADTFGILKKLCTADKQCMTVDCLSDADCSSSLPVCSANNTCAQCATDAQCTLSSFPRCDVATNSCVSCLVDADCPDFLPVCSSQFHACGTRP